MCLWLFPLIKKPKSRGERLNEKLWQQQLGDTWLLLDVWISYVENSWKHEAPNVKPD